MPAVWVHREERGLITYLADHASEGGDGGSFKTSTFNAAATHIAPLFGNKGARKTGTMCKNKYERMRAAWKVVCAIKKVSGWTWSDTTGASINEDTASSWDDYVARHPNAKNFRNSGFPHAADFEIIIPGPSTGANVFDPAAASPPGTSQATGAGTSTQLNADLGGDTDEASAPTAEDQDDNAPTSDDEQETSNAVATAGSKRRAAAATPPVSKRVKTSPAAAALADLSSSMNNFSNVIAAAMSTSPESARLSAAIQTAIRLETSWLSTTELGALVDLLSDKPANADTYLAMKGNEELRHDWVRRRLNIL